MEPAEWWRRYRQRYREMSIARHQLIRRSGIEPAQWVRLERGEGSPSAHILRLAKRALTELAQEKTGEAIALNLPERIPERFTAAQIRDRFDRIVRRETSARHVRGHAFSGFSLKTMRRVVCDCETVALGDDPERQENGIELEMLLEQLLQERGGPL